MPEESLEGRPPGGPTIRAYAPSPRPHYSNESWSATAADRLKQFSVALLCTGGAGEPLDVPAACPLMPACPVFRLHSNTLQWCSRGI